VQFREFLAQKATRSHATLEHVLDWVLFFFQIIFPFVMVFTCLHMSSRGAGTATDLPIPSSKVLMAPKRRLDKAGSSKRQWSGEAHTEIADVPANPPHGEVQEITTVPEQRMRVSSYPDLAVAHTRGSISRLN
jgi:hypothetical protein